MNKSDEKKTKLVDAIINLIDQNKKVSVHAVAKESKTPYGTFYYYFKNLDDAHTEAIQKIMMRGITWIDAEPGKNQSLEGKSNIFKIYFSWFPSY